MTKNTDEKKEIKKKKKKNEEEVKRKSLRLSLARRTERTGEEAPGGAERGEVPEAVLLDEAVAVIQLVQRHAQLILGVH
jgi:hypothetical protein